MKNFTALRLSLLFLILLGGSEIPVQGQDIYVRVWADGAMDGGDCSDCLGTTDGVDPRVTVRFKIGNSTGGGGSWGASYLTGVGDQGCDNWDDFNNNNPITSGLGNASYSEYIHVQMTGYESDGFTCSSDDGDCGGINWPTYNYSAGGNNHVQITGYAGGTCANGDYQSNRNGCSSDNSTNDYKIRYCYDFYFTNASSIATPTITATNMNECVGWDPPTIYGCCVTPSWRDRQWQVNVNGSGWTNISGQTGLNYNPPALGSAGTYQYRVYYRYAAAFSTNSSFHEKYSNIVTHTVAACPEQDFGNCVWNVNAYEGTDIGTLSNNTFKGYYVETADTYDSRNRWPASGSPEVASGYVGLPIGSDNNVVVSKRRCFPCGYYDVAVRHDDAYRLYIDGNLEASGGCCADPTGTVWTGSLDGNSTIEMRHQEGSGNAYQGVILDKIDYPDPGFGDGVWNVAVYNGRNRDLGIPREGYYVEPLLTYNSVNRWCSNCAPSDASGYQGCPVGIDNHTVVSKRTNFDCKYYQIDISNHDDEVRLFINGSEVFEEAACCHEHLNVWSGVLNASSTVEFRHAEGGGGSNQGLRFTEIAQPVASSDLAVICSSNPNPVTFSLNGASLAGNIPYNFVRWQFQWNGTAGTWSNWGTTNPYTWSPGTGNSGQTLYVRAEFSGAGCTKYSNIIPVYISPQPEGTVSPSSSQVCEGTQVDFTANMLVGNFVRFQYQWNGTGGVWNNWGLTNPYSWTPSSSDGGNTLYVRAEMANSVCTGFYTAPIFVQVDDASSVGNFNDPGPVESCDNAGNIPQISVSGAIGNVVWDWGEPNGTWHSWVAGSNAGTCCFPVNTAAANAGADRIRVRVTNGLCPEVTSSAVLIENQNSPPPSSLTSSISQTCSGYNGDITLTATIPYGVNTTADVISDYSSVQFFSGSCGGALLGTTGHTNGVASLVITAPFVTTTYYARSVSSCEVSTCASTTFTVVPDQTPPTTNTATPASGSTICLGATASVTANAGTNGISCTDEYQVTVNGGSNWSAYIPGDPITAAMAGNNTIQVRARRVCSGLECNGDYWNTLAMWNVENAGPELGFGNGIWHVNVYEGQDYNLGTTTIYGSYTEASLNYDTRTRWTGAENGTPASASGYVGCDPGVDGHTVVYKRQNFPCGIYTLDNTYHDDEVKVLIDGVEQLNHTTCCDQHLGFWTGYLGTGSTLEVRHSEGTGGSGQAMVFNNVTPAVTGGTIASDQTICPGGDPAMLTNSISAGGGVSAYFGAISYQWQSSTDNVNWTNIGGATGATYDPGVQGSTIYFRRVATDACGNTANSNTVTITVDGGVSSVAPTGISGPASICSGDAVTLTAIGGTLGTGGQYEWDDNAGFSSPVTTVGPVYTTPAMNANTTWYVRITDNCNVTGSTSHTVTILSPSSLAYLIQNGDPNGFDGSTLDKICEDAGWTFYTMSSIADKYVFAINWDPENFGGGHNAAAKAAAVPRINVDNTYTSAISTPAALCYATFAMARYWNVDIGLNSMDGPVLVRFYYDIQEANDIVTARNNHMSTYGCDDEGGFEWFKTQNTTYDPAVAVNPINITDGTYIYNFNTGGLTNNNVLYAELLVNSFSGGSGATGTGDRNDPLPVELVTFTATALTQSIRLDWTTLSEINNDRFDILRSIDGINFMKIAEMPGNGTTTEAVNYSYDDNDVEAGILYYYKLNQIDYDGSNEYSPVVSAMLDNRDQELFVGELIPNPTVNVSYIDLTLPNKSKVNVTVLNMLGQVMYSVDNIVLPSGNQRLEIKAAGLSKGNYLVSIQVNGGINFVRKMVVIE